MLNFNIEKISQERHYLQTNHSEATTVFLFINQDSSSDWLSIDKRNLLFKTISLIFPQKLEADLGRKTIGKADLFRNSSFQLSFTLKETETKSFILETRSTGNHSLDQGEYDFFVYVEPCLYSLPDWNVFEYRSDASVRQFSSRIVNLNSISK